MTADQIVAHYEQQWGVAADLVLNRTAGNRSAYHVTDGNGHYASVEHHWTGEGLDFQPAECPPMCACIDLMDCPVSAENVAADRAQLWNERRGA